MNLRRILVSFFAGLLLSTGLTVSAAETTASLGKPRDVKNVDSLPFLKAGGKEQYQLWMSASYNRAFAISPKDGSWGVFPDEDERKAMKIAGAFAQSIRHQSLQYAIQDALDRCQKQSGDKCFVYAQNGEVVWDGSIPQSTMVAQNAVVPETAGADRREREALAKVTEDRRQQEALPVAEMQPKAVASAAGAQRKALIFGNDSYQHIPTLKNARSDAKSMAKVLAMLGYSVRSHYDVNERDMKKAIRDFTRGIAGGDEVLFYFAGHGVQIGSANYLLPMDIRADDAASVRDEAIPLQRVLDDLGEVKAKFTLAIIDACRDNPFKGSGRAIGGRGLAPTSSATGQMVMFSAGAGQQALDNVGVNDKSPNGLFTRVFLKHVQKKGITVDRIMRDIRSEVVAIAESVGHEQVPAIYDQVVGDFYFAR